MLLVTDSFTLVVQLCQDEMKKINQESLEFSKSLKIETLMTLQSF